ncbi:CLUMA_CG006379, isoform A [Clunio marinus]|uniref:CLUMA_CG006379, isoform A n=1 Tax=Clunio marinus TaxID=568069 RepID=A0A1J1I214_9DIPT|nr:CLUMA_CG006379, isoform A [Clunio marinus]
MYIVRTCFNYFNFNFNLVYGLSTQLSHDIAQFTILNDSSFRNYIYDFNINEPLLHSFTKVEIQKFLMASGKRLQLNL